MTSLRRKVKRRIVETCRDRLIRSASGLRVCSPKKLTICEVYAEGLPWRCVLPIVPAVLATRIEWCGVL
jgi:hypothetical protein